MMLMSYSIYIHIPELLCHKHTLTLSFGQKGLLLGFVIFGSAGSGSVALLALQRPRKVLNADTATRSHIWMMIL